MSYDVAETVGRLGSFTVNQFSHEFNYSILHVRNRGGRSEIIMIQQRNNYQ